MIDVLIVRKSSFRDDRRNLRASPTGSCRRRRPCRARGARRARPTAPAPARPRRPCMDRPATLAGIAHVAGVLLELRVVDQCLGGQVEQPARHHAAPPPRRREELRPGRSGSTWHRQRCRLGVGRMVVAADARLGEHVEALGERRHQPVLDPVVHHLHEVPSPGRPQCSHPRSGGRVAGPPGVRMRHRPPGGAGVEDRRHAVDRSGVAAHHQAVAACRGCRRSCRRRGS